MVLVRSNVLNARATIARRFLAWPQSTVGLPYRAPSPCTHRSNRRKSLATQGGHCAGSEGISVEGGCGPDGEVEMSGVAWGGRWGAEDGAGCASPSPSITKLALMLLLECQRAVYMLFYTGNFHRETSAPRHSEKIETFDPIVSFNGARGIHSNRQLFYQPQQQ